MKEIVANIKILLMGGLIMRKRILSVVLALAVLIGLMPGNLFDTTVHAADFDSYIRELTALVRDTWSDDFLSEIEFRIDDPTVTINGEDVEIDPGHDATPYINDAGDTMFPLWVLSEVLDYDVGYSEASSDIDISGDGVKVNLRRGDKTMWVNGKRLKMSSAPTTKKGRTFVPARAVTESLLFDIKIYQQRQKRRINEALSDQAADRTDKRYLA